MRRPQQKNYMRQRKENRKIKYLPVRIVQQREPDELDK